MKKEAEVLYLKQSLCTLYNTLIYRDNPRLYQALESQHAPSFSLLLLARNILVAGKATYLAQVAELETAWDSLPDNHGSSCPIIFSEAERAEIEADVEGAVRGMDAMRGVQDSLGDLFPIQGFVRSELYDDAVEALRQICEQVVDEFAHDEQDKETWNRVWPFAD